MSHNNFQTTQVIDLDALMNSQVAAKDVGGIVSDQVANSTPSSQSSGNGEEAPGLGSSSQPNPSLAKNSGHQPSLPLTDLTRPVKTEGEVSSNVSTVSQSPPSAGASLIHPPPAPGAPSSESSGVQASSGDTTSSSSASLSVAMPTFSAFGSPLTALGAQLKLTSEEQAAAYKKANILALSALAKKGGPNAREMLAVQAKLQEFLTNLISLAGNSGQQLKFTVQLLVQQLVVSGLGNGSCVMKDTCNSFTLSSNASP